jgi:hypothetical protein
MSEENIENDEISLIDLLVVILRRRWLIIGLTLAAAVISGGFLLTQPQKQYQQYLEKEPPRPEIYQTDLTYSLSSSASSFINQSKIDEFVLLALNDAAADIEYSHNVKNTNGFFIVTFTSESSEQVTQRLPAMNREASTHLRRFLLPAALIEIQNFNDLTSLEKTSDFDLREAYYRYKAAERIVSGEEDPLMIIRESSKLISVNDKKVITLASIRKDLITKAIISVAAVFLLSIFLAFFLQAIENVKNDPVASEKIRNALGKNKPKNK